VQYPYRASVRNDSSCSDRGKVAPGTRYSSRNTTRLPGCAARNGAIALGVTRYTASVLLAGIGGRAATAAGQRGPGGPLDEEGLTVPGIADLPRLARQMTEAGIRVTVQIDPPAPQVARSVDLSAYRIVQEALTNTIKHGGAQSASVTVRFDGRAVDIEVRDDGRGAPAGYQPGRGLLGIAERVSAFGGGLQHGNGERGGFRLRAVLPAP